MELALALPGKKAGDEKISLSDETFGREYNEPLVHQTVVTYLAGARQGTVKQKTRSEVSGGGLAERVLVLFAGQFGVAVALHLRHVRKIILRSLIRKCIAELCSASSLSLSARID